MELLPSRCDESAYDEYVELFEKCFPGTNKYNRDYLDWLYRCNPDGNVVGFDARDGGRLAGHYVCIPVSAKVGGEEVKVLLSLNTATHPDYQGKGLFTQLAERTYAAGAAQGYDSVYGIANANSTPGFIRKLNFQLVGPLKAMVGIGSLGINFADLQDIQFQRTWSPEALAWRCACPINPLIARAGYDRTSFFAPALFGGACMAVAEIGRAATTASVAIGTTRRFASPLRLFIGQMPTAALSSLTLFANIPSRLRPSPLNLIYRSFSGRVNALNQDAVFLNFLDFDAY